MTDELTSEQEAAVRRLLAEARHDAPVPADVAARLDGVLDGLVLDERADDLDVVAVPGSSVVTELAGVRRRRRNAGRLLLAAAAVIVGGVAVGQNLDGVSFDADGGGSDSADSGLADAPRDGSGGAQEEAAGNADDDGGGDSAPAPTSSDQSYLLEQLRAPLRLSSGNFAADVQRELRRTTKERRDAAELDYDGLTAFAQSNPDFMCAPGAYGEGATLPAYYDSEEAVLVLRRPRSGIQHVDLLTCGTAVPLNSVDLPASP